MLCLMEFYHTVLSNNSWLTTQKRLIPNYYYCYFNVAWQKEVHLGVHSEAKRIWDGERIWHTGVKTQRNLTSNSTLSFYINNDMVALWNQVWSSSYWRPVAIVHLARVWAELGPKLGQVWLDGIDLQLFDTASHIALSIAFSAFQNET